MEAYAIPNQEAITVAKTLTDNMFCRFSLPSQLHSDMGAQFESELIKELCKTLQIRKTHTTPYHPQSDGLVERINRTIISMLATVVNDFGGEWEDHLPRVCFAYNTSQQESTGFTPFYLMFGRQARIPLDIMYQTPVTEARNVSQYMWTFRKSLQDAYALARDNLQTASSRQKELYDGKIHGKPYKVGDLVWLHNPAMPRGQARKLYCPWTGPYKVVKMLSTVVYRIQDTRGRRRRKVIHFNRLKPYLSRSNPLSDQAVTVDPVTMDSNQSTPTATQPPGTTLCLLDDEIDEADLDQHQASPLHYELTTSETSAREPGRRYPVRANRRRPLRYRDGAEDEEDEPT